MVRLLVLSLVILALILDVDAYRDSQEEVYLSFKQRHALCHLPFIRGNCGGFLTAWYYNDAIKKCEKKVFTRCIENRNRFPSKQECIEYCIDYLYI